MSALDLVSQLHRYSLAEYDELVELGAFEDHHVELLDGFLLDMSPKSERHEDVIAWLVNEWIIPTLDAASQHVRVSSSLRLGASQPEPDVAIVDRQLGPGRPSAALLVIEVALTSHERDLTLKPALYAPSVAEYWVLDLSKSVVVVHRTPHDTGYRDVTVHDRDSELRPQHATLGPLRLSELLEAI
jgi:Uma2 family endonuclease